MADLREFEPTDSQTDGFTEMADTVMEAIRELHARGGLDDVFGRLPDETAPPDYEPEPTA